MSDKTVNVRVMVAEWLQQHGYSGLYNDDGECGCRLGDLMPCDAADVNCQPGYARTCTTKPEDCSSADCDGDHAYCVGRVKPKETP